MRWESLWDLELDKPQGRRKERLDKHEDFLLGLVSVMLTTAMRDRSPSAGGRGSTRETEMEGRGRGGESGNGSEAERGGGGEVGPVVVVGEEEEVG